ncbi:MAG TPA: ParB/RepB/Spo0J family partition protein [Actinomycetes bacterium]|jgi:ParB family chromosome partitioning protein|nr:ParB/RepB/Spo0J family partition protein [Acidimicrobiia bacterium]HEX2155427.1 ParB/RepB/Spo0J family partition protein [Actinomycetes bacterium]
MRRRGGLGRGLEALIPSGQQEDRQPPAQPADLEPVVAEDAPDSSGPTFEQLPIDRIDPNPRQPREAFDEEPLQELTASIEAVGVLQPIVVRPSGERYQIVMGERRVRAARTAGLDRIPAIVRTTEDDQLLRDALLENVHREDLNPLEEAAAYEQLLLDFGITQEELAARLGRSRPVIANAMRLLRLPGSVQRRIAAKTLSAGHARAVASLDDPVQQERLADRIVAEGLTVRMAEELAQRIKNGEPLLGPDERARVRVRPAMQAPGMVDLAERLSDRLETRVRVQLGKKKGKVLIEFATLDDLQRICDAIGIEQRTVQLPQSSDLPPEADPKVVHDERTTTSASA